MCTCPPNSLSARIGYGTQWIRTVTAPTTAVECYYNPDSFFGNVNPAPGVGAGNFICQCEVPQILIRQREASPPLVQQSRAPTTRRRRGPCRSRAYANSPRGRRRQVPQFICPVGSYCPDGVTPTACPAGTTSIAGAVHPTDCFSQAGQSKTGAWARDPYLAALNAHQNTVRCKSELPKPWTLWETFIRFTRVQN